MDYFPITRWLLNNPFYNINIYEEECIHFIYDFNGLPALDDAN